MMSKNKEMKIFLTVWLLVCVTLFMTACGENKTDVTTAKTEVTMDTTDEETSAETIIESTIEQTDETADSAITALLVPENRRMLMTEKENSGKMTIYSDDKFDDLIAFYKEAIESLEAKGEEIDDDAASELLGDSSPIVADGKDYGIDSWSWTGTYEDGKTLTISVVGGDNMLEQSIVVDVEL